MVLRVTDVEKPDETTKQRPGLATMEGEQILRCAMCRREVKVWWSVDHRGLLTFGVSPANGDDVRYRQWLEQNRSP